MSRREEEFKHRTSIFEGAYRAWSHLGGIEVEVLFDTTKSVKDFDPVKYPLIHDKRISENRGKKNGNHVVNTNDDGSVRMEYPYEPLPRCGLTHPYIQAILSPWLGPNADQDAIELGLATLRTWWQHRRKGENKSSLRILGTSKMRVIVDKYTKHFFDLAFCLVTNDYVQAPRTLHMKLKQSDMFKHRFITHRSNSSNVDDDDDEMSTSMTSSQPKQHQSSSALPIPPDELAHLTPLERMHVIQKNALLQDTDANHGSNNAIHIKGKCIPGKIDLPGIVAAVKRQANNLAHRGSSGGTVNDSGNSMNGMENSDLPIEYGDPTTTPLVFVSSRNDYSIVLKVDGITCAHCVKIVETVLKGCAGTISMNGNKSPINGLLDAAADHGVSSVIVLIDHPNNAKRIAYESKRNLSLVGYVAQAMTIPLMLSANDNVIFNGKQESSSSAAAASTKQQQQVQRSMFDVAKAFPIDFFDFNAPCTCPDSGVYRENCPRHSQMDDNMFDKLSIHERRVNEYIQSKRVGEMNVTTDDTVTAESSSSPAANTQTMIQQQQHFDQSVVFAPAYDNGSVGVGYNNVAQNDHLLHIDQPMQFLSQDVHENTLMMNEPLSLIDVDPIPYFNQNQRLSLHQEHHHQSLLHPVSSNFVRPNNNNDQAARHSLLHHTNTATNTTAINVNRRISTSALSIDWEVYELFNEFVATDDHEAMMMRGPMEDYHPNSSRGNSNPTLSQYHSVPQQQQQQLAQQQQLVQQQQQQQLQMNSHDDVFQV